MMSGQQICLKWNSFQSNIVTSFESLWEEEGLVDVTLASDGQCLRAHKLILSACSPFFRKVFQSNPCQHPVIILQDVHFKELEALLSFVYKGEVNIDQENLPALLKAAETLQIRGLSGASEHVKEKLKSSPSDLDGSQDAPPLKRPRSSQSSHSPPIALTPPSRCPSTSSEPFESDCLPQIEPKLELHNSEPPSPESPLMAPEDSADSFQMAGTVQKGSSKGETSTIHSDPNFDPSQASRNFPYPPFPCPFCDRAYTSWGFRRRHIKAVHTQSQSLPCKWCLTVLPSHADWEKHVTKKHHLSLADAHNGLLILEEAHMVLQIPHPTRLDTFISMIQKEKRESSSSVTNTESRESGT